MQIVGGRWEVCLGDGSCVLPFLSFPSACVNLCIMVQTAALAQPGPLPRRLLAGPGPPPYCGRRSPPLQKQTEWPHPD